MKILGLSDDNDDSLMNKSLVKYSSTLFDNAQIELLDLKGYEVEFFSFNQELGNSIPNGILELANKISQVDLLIVSLTKYSSFNSSVLKNIYDWLAKTPNRKVGEIPILLMATSLDEKYDSNIISAEIDKLLKGKSGLLDFFYLSNFEDNFKKESISNVKMRIELIQKINRIKSTRFKHFYKDDSFTCGIDPSKDDCGDAIEY